MIFLLNCQQNPAIFYAKNRTNLSQKLSISQWFTFKLFKMADFFLNLNLRNFLFFYFSIISETAQDILKILKVLSSWCYKL